MYEILTKEELYERHARLRRALELSVPEWETAVIVGRVNQYYLEGTMQDGILILKRGGGSFYFVRKSFERARLESPMDNIYRMESYRDAAAIAGADFGVTCIETDIATLSVAERLRKYFSIKKLCPLDRAVMSVRSVKTPYELYWTETAGSLHNEFLLKIAPGLMREGISEAEFTAELYCAMVRFGHQGISRFSMFQTEMVAGQVGFGDSSLCPTSFDGPGGARGISPAVPLLGSRERTLKKGDLVFVDVGFGVNGYTSDKTQVYMFNAEPSRETVEAHRGCIEIQKRTAELLRPGAVPSEIYRSVTSSLTPEFKQNFMGYGARAVKFLGHGIGLHVDEPPAIAEGFNAPLEENMVIALEPKKGIPGVGMVGVEDTYIVTPGGGRCVSGGGCDIITV